MYRIKDIKGVKPSLRGKRVDIIRQNKSNGTMTIELLENTRKYKAGTQIISFSDHIEEIEE